MTRPAWTGESFEALPLTVASTRLKAMKEEHAKRLAEKFNADECTAEVAAAFGPGDVAS